MAETARLQLPLIASEQALKHVTHNEAIQALDGVVQLVVEARDIVTPPLTPTIGQGYEVGISATGDWVGEDGNIAIWTDSGWRFSTPGEGWVLWDKSVGGLFVFSGVDWAPLSAALGSIQNVPMLGVNATADTSNKLTVRSNAILFNALEAVNGGSGDMRLTLNREAGTDTASFVFQSGYSGRAEIGLAGNDDFSFKVSPDGSIFHTGMTIDKDAGFVTFNKLLGSEPSFPTIAAGVMTVTTSYVVPAPEGGISDTVDTISGGFEGAMLVITGTSGVTLTFADGTGNLKLGGTRVLDQFEDSLLLIQRGTDWIELAYANNG